MLNRHVRLLSMFFMSVSMTTALAISVVLQASAQTVASAGGTAASAKPTSAKPTPAPETEVNCEAVRVAGIEITCLERGIGSFSARERADAIRDRVLKLAQNRTFDAAGITVIESETSSEIVAGDNVIASLTELDFDGSQASSRTDMAEVVAARMRSAIDAERTLRSPATILWGVGYTVLATLGLIFILVVLSRIYPRVYGLIQRSQGRHIRSVKIQSFELLNATRIVAVLMWLARASRVILTLFALYIYVPLVLSFFPWTANWAPKLYGYIVDPLVTIIKVFVDYIPNMFFIVAIAMVTRYLLKLVHFFFREVEVGALKFEGFYKEWAEPTYKLVRILIIAFAFIMAFPYLPGSDSPAFQGISVFLGILLSLGSSSAVANIVAGVVLTYMRPFKVGDRVKIADTTGDVLEKNLLVTRVRTIKNVDITIPNAMVLGSHITNYSSTAVEHGLVLNTTITIGYDVPWRQVHELLKQAAARTGSLIKERQPFVLQTALNDFYVHYELNVYTNLPNKMAVIYSELHQNIQDCFNEAGVEIMSPHYGTLRDGNEVTIPSEYRKADYEVPKFRVEGVLPQK